MLLNGSVFEILPNSASFFKCAIFFRTLLFTLSWLTAGSLMGLLLHVKASVEFSIKFNPGEKKHFGYFKSTDICIDMLSYLTSPLESAMLLSWRSLCSVFQLWLFDIISDVQLCQFTGSVNGSNCAELAKQEDIDGFLVGGASLKVQSYKLQLIFS